MIDRRTWKQRAALSAALLVLGGCGGSDGGGVAPVATAATRSVQSVAQAASPAVYNIGTGISDITGEAAEAGMFGYSKIDQQTGGIHQRQHARAFIVEDPATKQRVAVVVTETGAVMQGVQQAVLARLKARYGALYSDANVLLTATHTHAGPGGFSHYALYNLNALGYLPQTFNAISMAWSRPSCRRTTTCSPARSTSTRASCTTPAATAPHRRSVPTQRRIARCFPKRSIRWSRN